MTILCHPAGLSACFATFAGMKHRENLSWDRGRLWLLAVSVAFLVACPAGGRIYRFVYCSDLHYGLTREFRGRSGVSASEVSRAMLAAFSQLPSTPLPDDGGVGAGTLAGKPDFVVCTGDIGNRMEKGVQPAAQSWAQFCRDWNGALDVPLYLVPGNHDLSNAIGYTKPLTPPRDATAAAGIFNRAMRPAEAVGAADFDYARDRVHYVVPLDGVRLVMMGMWPDTLARGWFEREVASRDSVTPVLLFTHDPPAAEAKHFTNPRPPHDVNARDGFQNLLADTCSVSNPDEEPRANWARLAAFVARHRCVKAYFHGDKNYNEFYNWHGPDGRIDLPTFRVDSPMKGEATSADERRLSFIHVVLDTDARRLTVRECLWNRIAAPGPLGWGDVATLHY